MAAVPQWLAKLGISKGGTWDDHIARRSAGGVDYPAPVGTKILAPAGGGWLSFRYLSDGSSVLRVEREDGSATEFLHGRRIDKSDRQVAGLEAIGVSDGRKGADGAGGSSGPHIHVHDTVAGSKVRRAYPFSTVSDGGSSGGGSATPSPVLRSEIDMYCIGLDRGLDTAVTFSIGIGILQRHSQERQQALAAAQAQQPGGCYWYDDDDFARTMWNHGLGEFTVAQARALQGNGHLIAKAVYGTGATLTAADRAAIAAEVRKGLAIPTLEQIAALDDAEHQALAKALAALQAPKVDLSEVKAMLEALPSEVRAELARGLAT